jgi:superfamily II DNA/RNA helicase
MAALPLMFRERSLLVVAPTGSGKTLAYTVPLLTIIKVRRGKGNFMGIKIKWGLYEEVAKLKGFLEF